MSLISGTESSDSRLEGTDQDDLIYGKGGNDALFGLGGADLLVGGEGGDHILTGDGQDTVDGGPGNDEVNGYISDAKNVTLMYSPSTGSKSISGGEGSDVLAGGGDSDIILGGSGNDQIFGIEGNDNLFGDAGNDELYGDSGNDSLSGGEGNDNLNGGEGSDYLEGQAGDDDLFGDDGNDILKDGAGIDLLFGGKGDDTFYLSSRETVAVDSGGSDTAYVSADFIDVPHNIETVIYETGVLPLPYWIDALIFGKGYSIGAAFRKPDQAFYTFPVSAPTYAADQDVLLGYTGFSQAQIVRVEAALQYITSIFDMKFVRTETAAAYDTLSFAYNSQTGSSGYAMPPSPSYFGSDIFLSNTSFNATLADGTRGTVTLMHEIGHALGLKHPFLDSDADSNLNFGPYLPAVDDSQIWTVMSYNRVDSRNVLEFSPLDIAALHYLYGVNPATRPGDDTYFFDASTPNLIWDGAGTDVIDASASKTAVTINLTPGHWGFQGNSKAETITEPGQITVNFGTVIENLKGSNFNDSLAGNETANILTGGKGDDTISGGAGIDTAMLTGSRSQYIISQTDTGLRVADSVVNRDGNDSLQGIERLTFSDVSLAFDMSGSAGLTARVLGAALGKESLGNSRFVGTGLSLLDGGMKSDVLMGMALDARLGSTASSAEVVDLLFNNIVGSNPPSAERAYFAGLLDNGVYSRGQFGLIAAVTSMNEENINLIGLAKTGLEYS